MTSGPDPGEFPGFWGSMVFLPTPIPRKGSGNQQQQQDECNEFFSHLNSLHPSLRFTFEKECNRTLPFLDVLVEKNDHEFVTSIYRKPTFTGQYIHWNSFCPMKRKTNLISTLVHRALVICSKSTLENELSNIRSILMNNGYPEAIINTVMTKKMN